MTVIHLECKFEDLPNFRRQVIWLEENNITLVATRICRQSLGFPTGWFAMAPAIKFESEEDAMAYKLRWL